MDFDNFFRNQFDTKEISDNKIGRFTLEMLPHLGGYARFAVLVAPTLAAYEAYFGATADEATKLAIQVSLTRAMDRALADFKSKVSQHEGAVRSKWGIDAPEYLRFYPQGLTEYSNATLSNVAEKITRYEAALNDANLGAKLAAEVKSDFLNNGSDGKAKGAIVRFREARQAQIDAKGATGASKAAAHTSRDTLEIQLQVVLLAVAQDAATRSKEERAELRRIFPQYILEGRTPTPEEAAPAPSGSTPPPVPATHPTV